MRKLSVRIFLLLLTGVVLFPSCDPHRVYEQYEAIPENRWDRNHIVRFEVNITDTLTPHNLYVDIRNSGKYEMANLWLFIRTISPQGIEILDTLQCVLADEDGRWRGSGLGDIFDLQIPFKSSVVFPYSGIYVFEYEQGMRTSVLSGIRDMGLRIERVDK